MFKSISGPVAMITLFAFCLTMLVIPDVARASYRDHSGDLPGMDKGGSYTPYIVGTAVLAVGVTTLVIIKHRSKEKDKGSSFRLNSRDWATGGLASGRTSSPTPQCWAPGPLGAGLLASARQLPPGRAHAVCPADDATRFARPVPTGLADCRSLDR
jgi:hypothetical protein